MHCLVLFLLFGVKFLYANELNDKQSHSKHLGVNRHAKHRLKMKQRKPWPGSVDNKNSSDVGDINAGDEFWVDSKYLREWYTNLDLCILQNTSNDTTQVIMAKCESEAMGRGEDLTKQPTRCRAGNSWPSKGEYCSSEDIPFSNRKTLYRSIIGYDDPSAKPLKTFFETSAKENGALLLVGDSVMQQFYAAMACELEREGLWSDPTQFTNTDELKHVTIGDMNVPIKFAPIYHFVNGRWDREANASMKALRKHVEGFVDSHHSLTILINMGLHYVSNPIAQFSREDYFIQMTGCLQYLNEIALLAKPEKKIRVLWRETSAQHFPTPNGYWPGVKFAASMKLTCNPISDSTPTADWRNSDIRKIIIENKLSRIRIIPFYNVTLSLWSSHVNGHLRDCTHFCWSPMLYQSLFHALADVISEETPNRTNRSNNSLNIEKIDNEIETTTNQAALGKMEKFSYVEDIPGEDD